MAICSRQTRQKNLLSVEWMLQKSPLLHAIQKLIEARPSHTADLPLRNIVDTGLSDYWARVLRFALIGRELKALNGGSMHGMSAPRFER